MGMTGKNGCYKYIQKNVNNLVADFYYGSGKQCRRWGCMEERFNQVLEFLQKKYPERSSEELFDLLEVIICSSDILESVNFDKELAARELIKRYGDAEDRGEIEAEQEEVAFSLKQHPEFKELVKSVTRSTIDKINKESPTIKSSVRQKKRFVLVNVIRELEKLL